VLQAVSYLLGCLPVPQAYRSCLRGHYCTINAFILTFPDFLKPHMLSPFCFIDFCYDVIFFRAISFIFHAVQQKCKDTSKTCKWFGRLDYSYIG